MNSFKIQLSKYKTTFLSVMIKIITFSLKCKSGPLFNPEAGNNHNEKQSRVIMRTKLQAQY